MHYVLLISLGNACLRTVARMIDYPTRADITIAVDYRPGSNLAKNCREKFLLSRRKFERSLDPNFVFSYIIYTFSLLPQLQIEKFVHLGDYFSLVTLLVIS